MRPPATCAEGANLNDNKVKSLAAGSVCFSVSEKGSLACAPHSCCFGNLKLSIRHRLCRSPIAKQREMLSLAVTNDCQQRFRGRKSSFQMYYIQQARERREPVVRQTQWCQWDGPDPGSIDHAVWVAAFGPMFVALHAIPNITGPTPAERHCTDRDGAL